MAAHAPPIVPDVGIDMGRNSRQYYVYGESAMKRMASSNVLLAGLNGVGIEIAKNVALAGVKTLTLMDHRPCVRFDMGTQFYVTEADLGQNRAEVSAMRVSELNPYVKVSSSTENINTIPLEALKAFDVIVLVDVPLARQLEINQFARSQPTPIRFLTANVRGISCMAFADFGDSFEVLDMNGEDPITIAIASISNAKQAVVSLQFNHHFPVGAPVTFRDVTGMPQLNNRQFKIVAVTDDTLTIDADTSGMGAFGGYGEVVEVKVPRTIKHNSLAHELKSPTGLDPCDFVYMDAPATIFCAYQALEEYRAAHGDLPPPWDAAAAAQVVERTRAHYAAVFGAGAPDDKLAQLLACTARGALAPLTGFIGSVVAQEVIKAVSGKFRPLSQWMALDARDVVPDSPDPAQFQPTGTRYDELVICVGAATQQKLADTKTFMVGAGAIGCEMLKYFALLGVGTGPHGSVIVTDPDVIEESNLSRQFLFREKDLRSLKSQAASAAVQRMNPALKPDGYAHKVGPDTERIFTDKFFESQDVCVNALDNVEARLYMDNRCVLTQRPLLESGTLGTKGHVQAIVPFLTESYATRRDPPSKDFAVCTVKAFPTQIEHTIQWAKMKFSMEFQDKPTEVSKFFQDDTFISEMHRTKGPVVRTLKHIISALSTWRMRTMEDCVRWARSRFEKLFNHFPRNLLLSYPLDHRNTDGTLFWTMPKRPPHPIQFDIADPLHVSFVESAARLQAKCYGIPWVSHEAIVEMIRRAPVPEYVPKAKKVSEGEAGGDEAAAGPITEADIQAEIARLKGEATALAAKEGRVQVSSEEFEKDDDSNYHVAFITAASNLRARAYDIAEADFNKTKQIAGRIIPAIATTTAAVSGLVALELIKLRMGLKVVEKYRNTGLNLADPFVSMYTPDGPPLIEMRPGLKMSFWDRFDIDEGDITVGRVLQWFKEKYDLKVNAILQEQVMIYSWINESLVNEPMRKVLRVPPRAQYVYLDVSFSGVRIPSVKHIPPKLRFYVPAVRRAAPARKVAAAAATTDDAAGPADA